MSTDFAIISACCRHDKHNFLTVCEEFCLSYMASGDGNDQVGEPVCQGGLFDCQLAQQITDRGAFWQSHTQPRRTCCLCKACAKPHVYCSCHC